MRHWLSATVVLAALALLPSSASAGVPGRWDRISPTTEANIDEPAAVRTADGVLHVVFRQKNATTTADSDLVHVPINAAGTVAAPSFVAQDWAGVTNPALITDPAGLRAIFGGQHTTSTTDPNQNLNTATSSSGGGSWALFPGPIATGGYVYGSDQAAIVGPGGVPFEAWGSTAGLFVHRGLDPAAPNNDFQTQFGGCCGYDPGLAVDAATGQLWVAWFSNATGHQGVFAQNVEAGSGAPVASAVLMPGSVTTYNGAPNIDPQLQRTPITGRPGKPGVFVAYPGGYPSHDAVLLWQLGAAASTVIARGSGVRTVSVASDPAGRLWVTWSVNSGGVPRVFARRSNPAATLFGATVAVAAPPGIQTDFRMDPFAQAGVLDVLGNFGAADSSDAIWHTQIQPGMTVTVKPSRLHRKSKTKLTVSVQDAGQPIAGATVKLGAKTATTNGAGKARLAVGKAHHRTTLTVTDPGYAPQQVQLGLKR